MRAETNEALDLIQKDNDERYLSNGYSNNTANRQWATE